MFIPDIYTIFVIEFKTNIMKPKHTPGEWRIEATEQIGFNEITTDGCTTEIAATRPCDPMVGHIERAEANAKLIAVAPDLLEALNEMQEYVSRNFNLDSDFRYYYLFKIHQKAMKAIKKATE